MPTFTSGNDTYVVSGTGTYNLDFLGGDDKLTVQGGDSTTADMGDGNDIVQLKSGLANVLGGLGADRFDLWAAGATVDGGADNDTINVRGAPNIFAAGGIGDDRFNIYADSVGLTLDGGDGNDDFFGYYHSVLGSIYGGLGSDYFVQFIGGAGIYGGDGNDIYRADASNPASFIENAGEGTDSVQVARGASYSLPDNIENISVQGFHGSTTGPASLSGNALSNVINGHANVELISGGDGNDRLFGKGGDDTLWGGDGNDYLDGGVGVDTIEGDAGNDTINGRAGADHMFGGTGDDVYYVDDQGDQITEYAGEGIDTVRTSALYGLGTAGEVENAIQIGTADLLLDGNALANVLIGNSGNSVLRGLAGNDTLNGGSGNDILWGGTENDTLIGGTGNDTMHGEEGNDSLNGGAGVDSMEGGTGNDLFYVDDVGDVLIENAGEGTDTVILNVAGYIDYVLPTYVENGTFNGNSGTLTGNALDNVLTDKGVNNELFGLDGNDMLYAGTYVSGDIHVTRLHGGNGNDALYAGSTDTGLYGDAGTDTLTGGKGNDYLDGGAGDDVMHGGAGDDIYVIDSLTDVVDEADGEGTDTIFESFASYTLQDDIEWGEITLGTGAKLYGNLLDNHLAGGAGNDEIHGDDGDDTLVGWGGNDVLYGEGGSNTLYGNDGNDLLYGWSLSDYIAGDAGDDKITGGDGRDYMYGGTGSDTFIFNAATESVVHSADEIEDFETGIDKIDLSVIDADSTSDGNQAFTFVQFPSGDAAGQATVTIVGGVTHLFLDVDGGGYDMEIDVVGTFDPTTDVIW